MFKTSIKTILAVGVLALGTAVTVSAPANAGGNFSVYIGDGHGSGVYFGKGHGRDRVHYRHGHRPHFRGHDRRSKCKPRRALRKAYRYGLDDPYIKRINHNRVVVRGWNRGHPAKIVFSRHGHGCPIIKARGI